MKLLALASSLALTTLLAPASAQVTIDSTLNVLLTFSDPGPAGEVIVPSFDAGSSDKLVVVISAEHSFGITTPLTLDGIEYGGTPLVEAVQENSVPGASAVYYLDSPGPAAELRLFTQLKNGGYATILALSGTQAGVEATGQSITDTVTLSANADSFVVAGILDGGQASNGNGAVAPTAASPMTELQSAVWGPNMWGAFSCGYQFASAAGPVTSMFLTAGPLRLRSVAAAFGSSAGSNYCGPAVPNSTGASGSIAAVGSSLVQDNDITLIATNLRPGQFGMFLNSMTQGFTPNPGSSQGNLCLFGAIGRYNPAAGYPVQSTSAAGTLTLQIDLPSTPTPGGFTSITVGQTWNFQTWYRDLNPAPTSNFTDGVSVLFQ